jgi:hypothetical protein
MKAVVADVYGDGVLVDKDGEAHTLSPDSWTEADVRDTIYTSDNQKVVVRYRDNGLEMEIGPNSTYGIEAPENPDVIDVRSHWPNLAQEVYDALKAGQDNKVVELLREAASPEEKVPDALEDAFYQLAGKSLRDAIMDDMAGIWELVALYFVD